MEFVETSIFTERITKLLTDEAYRELQAEGILEIVRGIGLEISPKAVKRCQQGRDALIRERLRSVLIEARQSQLDDQQLREMFEQELRDAKPKSGRKLKADGR